MRSALPKQHDAEDTKPASASIGHRRTKRSGSAARCPTELHDSLLALFDASPGFVTMSNPSGDVLYANSMTRALLGIERTGQSGSVLTPKVSDLYSARAYEQFLYEAVPTCLKRGFWRGETVFVTRDKREISASQVLTAHHVPAAVGDVMVFSSVAFDIDKYKRVEEALRYQATHDALTGLPNHALLMDRLKQAISSAERRGRLVAVLFADLDGFKRVNDQYGHETANLLLRDAAKRLTCGVRAEDTVARYGGDEFVLIAPEAGAPTDVARLRWHVEAVFYEPFVVAGKRIHVAASVGSAIYPLDAHDAEALLRKADSRMHRSKANARDSANARAQHEPPPGGPRCSQSLGQEPGLRAEV